MTNVNDSQDRNAQDRQNDTGNYATTNANADGTSQVASQHASEEDALDAIDALDVQDDADAINDYAHQHGIDFLNGRAYPRR